MICDGKAGFSTDRSMLAATTIPGEAKMFLIQ